MPLVWTHSCFRGKTGRIETLDSFSRVCSACTNSADIYFLWWIVKNKRSSSGLVEGAARMPEVLNLLWCLASLLPHYCTPPTPVSRWPGCCPQCTSTQRMTGGPSLRCALGMARQSKAAIFMNGLTSGHAAQLSRAAGRTIDLNLLFSLYTFRSLVLSH